jgi:hypothetical protein
MKILSFIILLSLCACRGSIKPQITENQERCLKFHDGIFVYKPIRQKNIKVYRQGNTQIEYNGDTKFICDIYWPSDCQYVLIPKSKQVKDRVEPLPQDTTFVNIIEIVSDSVYRYSAISKGRVREYNMAKIK